MFRMSPFFSRTDREIIGLIPLLSIVVPVFNEEPGIELLLTRLVSSLEPITSDFEILFVNDGSSDGTLSALLEHQQKDPRIAIIDLSRNFGKEIAMSAGLEAARGQAVVPMDADLQHPPEVIGDMVARWREGYDMVYATRKERLGESPFKLFTARAFYWLMNRMSDTPIPPDTGDFRLMDRRVVDAVNRLPERSRFMKGIFAWVGFRQTSVEFEQAPRSVGTTKWNYTKLWRFALNGLFSFSVVPIKVWSYIGLLVAGLSLAYGTFLLSRTILQGVDVPGYASTLVVILFLGGIQLIGLGVLGEYIGRIFDEAKGRPLYFVRKTYRAEAGDPEKRDGSS
jgi:glycosyltransferase involved in cell wall biosynthesis